MIRKILLLLSTLLCAVAGVTGKVGAAQTTFDLVADCGGDQTGATSSRAAFALCVTKALAVNLGPGYGTWSPRLAGTIHVPKGLFVGLGPNDIGNSVGLTIEGEGKWGSALYFNGYVAGDIPASGIPPAALDGVQTSALTIKKVGIFSQNPDGSAPTVIPGAAIILANSAAAPTSCNQNRLNDVVIQGYTYSPSASWPLLVSYNCTNSVYNYDVQPSENKASVYIGSNNAFGVSSPYRAIGNAPFASTEIDIMNAETHGFKSAAATWPTMYLDGVQTLRYIGGNMDGSASGQGIVYFSGSNNANMTFLTKFYSEAGHAPGWVFLATTGSTVDRLTVSGSTKDAGISSTTTFSAPPSGGSFTNTDAGNFP